MGGPDASAGKKGKLRRNLIDFLIDHPWEYSATDVSIHCPGRKEDLAEIIKSGIRTRGAGQLIMERLVPVLDKSGKIVKRRRIGLNREHPDAPDDTPFPPEESQPAPERQ